MYSGRLASLAASAFALSLLAAHSLSAQIGHLPSKSPYEDFKIGQTISVLAGWFETGRDPAGVAAKGSPTGSIRYDIGVGGPASLYARYLLAPSTRDVLIPGNPANTRLLGTQSANTHLVDLGFDISLTGKKTWHHLMPSLNMGAGLVGEWAAADTGSYRFGTKFAFSYGGSIRFLPNRGPQIRLDLSHFLWQYQYPDRYFIKASDTTSVLTNTKQRSAWRNNLGASIGVSIPIFK